MNNLQKPSNANEAIIIVGAGIAGLATAVRLVAAGHKVIVLERHASAGGKIRCQPSDAGPVDTGPTVLTMRHVFDDLFAQLNTRIEDYVVLAEQDILARHFWPDGSTLDLFASARKNIEAIERFAGSRAAGQFKIFTSRTKALYEGFDRPVMQEAEPSFAKIAAHVLKNPALARHMAPLSTLHALLTRSFDDPRLVQLFGRYATYVGGSPYKAPALLSLIWHAESAGVWVVEGGIHKLTDALVTLAAQSGANFEFEAHVSKIDVADGHVTGVTLANGRQIKSNTVVFNGDPRALATGLLGEACRGVAPQTAKLERSLSANVWAFAAQASGPELAHHNVFFRTAPKPEFDALAHGRPVNDPTLYVCAMDRGMNALPPPLERFEIIANAAPTTKITNSDQQKESFPCQMQIFQTLAGFGLHFDPTPKITALTTPKNFGDLFPGTAGSLYGQTPHGTTAAFKRPTARSPIRGLYLAGGGTHPGAGVPMATLSGKHAAEAILNDQTSTSMSRQTGMRGGTSTESAKMVRAPSV